MFPNQIRLTEHSATSQVLAATQTPGVAGKNWFQGTADAVRQFHWLFEVPIKYLSRYIMMQDMILRRILKKKIDCRCILVVPHSCPT